MKFGNYKFSGRDIKAEDAWATGTGCFAEYNGTSYLDKLEDLNHRIDLYNTGAPKHKLPYEQSRANPWDGNTHLRPRGYRALHGKPMPSDGNPFGVTE